MSSFILRDINAELFDRAKKKLGGSGSVKPLIETLLAEWVNSTSKTPTERMEAARAAHLETMTRELLMAGILSRIWPAFLCQPQKPDEKFPATLCIDSPAGRLAYKLTADEMEGFTHIEFQENDGVGCSPTDKLARLLHLATEGWK